MTVLLLTVFSCFVFSLETLPIVASILLQSRDLGYVHSWCPSMAPEYDSCKGEHAFYSGTHSRIWVWWLCPSQV